MLAKRRNHDPVNKLSAEAKRFLIGENKGITEDGVFGITANETISTQNRPLVFYGFYGK